MFRKKITISGGEAINLYEGCLELSSTSGVKPLVTYRLVKNCEALEPFVKGLEEQKKIIISEYSIKDEKGDQVIINNEYVFENEDKQIVLDELNKLFDSKEEFTMWHFEAQGIANDNARILGKTWVKIGKIVTDDESIVE